MHGQQNIKKRKAMSLSQLPIGADGSNFNDICNRGYYRGQTNEDKEKRRHDM